MKIFVKAKPKAKRDGIEKIDKNHFVVYVKQAPEQGRANKAIAKIIAKYFQISLSQVVLKSGIHSRNKVFEVDID